MGKLILIRHGESVGNRERLFATTPHELALTDLGYQQAREAGRRIAKLFRAELVVASSYIRAHETGRVIAEMLGLSLELEHKLHERHIGALQGESYDSILTAPGYDPQRPWLWKPDGGESFDDVKARVGPILDRLAKAHPTRDVVVVSHGGVMMALWAYVTGEWDNVHVPPNCGIVLIEHGAHGYSKPQVLDDIGNAEHAVG